MSCHRVAVIQAGTSLFDTEKTLDRMEALCRQAAEQNVELAVFPEAYIGGYPKGLDFGARMGTRTEAGREDFLRYWKAAIDVPGKETARIGSFAAKMKAYLVVGVIERSEATLYCTALFFAPDGTLIGKHRKLMPTATERLVWGQGDGSTIEILDTAVGKLGAAICWENYMPALRQVMYAGGVNIWCAPTVDQREIWQVSMRHIAYEGRLFVLSACQYMTRADAPSDYDCIQGDDPETELIAGGSVIIDPMGNILAGPLYGQEGVLVADIDLSDTIKARYDLDVSGHYGRPDIFEIKVDRQSHQVITDQFSRDQATEKKPVSDSAISQLD